MNTLSQSTFSFTNNAGVPPVPPEAHQRAILKTRDQDQTQFIIEEHIQRQKTMQEQQAFASDIEEDESEVNFQFYPTPPDLARKALGKFKDRNFKRILEPSAGEGHLVKHIQKKNIGYRDETIIDCCEIDVIKHAYLRELKCNVVGLDFLLFQGLAVYSHVIMNPPFSRGVDHVLKAWDGIFDGEIVAILNAQTIKNPFSRERARLVKLIEQHGEVEFIQNAFSGSEVERKTEVEIALVYLKKEARTADILGEFLTDLAKDKVSAEDLAKDYQAMQELAIPTSEIENQVAIFNAAVKSMQEAIIAKTRAAYYRDLLKPGKLGYSDPLTDIKEALSVKYDKLKGYAWDMFLHSSNLRKKLSKNAIQRFESEFETIKKLEFSVPNIYAFLGGVINSQGKIQSEMICDTFDVIGRYHSDNCYFYMGWKSNDKHRTCGVRIKDTRFILPISKDWNDNIGYEHRYVLEDLDKTFSILAGQAYSTSSLANLFGHSIERLKNGERMESEYFEVRYYKGIGTIHFFPKDKKLIDRLNRWVGQMRKWIPHDAAEANPEFWKQYEQAEKFQKYLLGKTSKEMLWACKPSPYPSEEEEKLKADFGAVMAETLAHHGFNVNQVLAAPKQSTPCIENFA